MNPPEIIVGVDGSPGSREAVTWAAREAAARSSGLLVLHAYDWRTPGARAQVGGAYAETARTQAEAIVAAAIEEARAEQPAIPVRGEAVLGGVGATLVAASRNGSLVVVGSRGRGGFGSLLLGSVSQQVATHAAAPVVVVRGRHEVTDGPVVVGVDGSGPADHACGLAFAEAERHGLSVFAVRAYSPARPTWGFDTPPYVEDPDERRDAERETLQHTVVPWSDKYPSVPVETVAVAGHAGEALTRLSNEASLLVIGSRGRGGFAGLMLGSVGLHLLHHSQCPILIDRGAEAS